MKDHVYLTGDDDVTKHQNSASSFQIHQNLIPNSDSTVFFCTRLKFSRKTGDFWCFNRSSRIVQFVLFNLYELYLIIHNNNDSFWLWYWFPAIIIIIFEISPQKMSYKALNDFLWRKWSALTRIYHLSLKKAIVTAWPPLEAVKVLLIFSQNHYDFRNQCPEKILKRLNLHSLEAMKCNDPNP